MSVATKPSLSQETRRPVLYDYARHRPARRDAWDRLEPRIRNLLIGVGLVLSLVVISTHLVRYVNLRHENTRLHTTNAELRQRLCGAIVNGRMHACP